MAEPGKELAALDCPTMAAGAPHEWVYIDREDDLYQIYKCTRCFKTVYEQVREFGTNTQ